MRPSPVPPAVPPLRCPAAGSRRRPGDALPLRKVVLAVLLAVVVVASGARPASAHAELSGTEPASGAVLAESPADVVLRFTEDVSVEADGVRILDSSGERRDAGTAAAAGAVVNVPVDGTLDRGGYVVAWRVTSADGHPINGAFQFSVGIRTQVDADVVDGAFGSGSDERDQQIGNVLRAVAYLCTLVAAGAVAVGARLRRAHEPSPVTRWVALLAGVGMVAILLQVPVQTSRMTGRGWGSVTEAGVLGRALGDGFGWSIGLTIVGLVLIGITAGLPFRRPVPVIALVGALLAPVGFALAGHTRTMSPSLVAYVADTVHLVAAAIWFGGLVALLVVLGRRRADDDVLGAGAAVGAFSSLAGLALALVAVSGLTMGWIEVGGLDALTETTYGKLLMLKVGLVGLVALGGTWNRYRLVPHLVGRASADDGVLDGAATPEPLGSDAVVAELGGSDLDGPGPGPEETAHDVSPHRTATLDPGDADPPETGSQTVRSTDRPERGATRWETLGRILRLEVAVLVAVVGITGVLVTETPAKQQLQRVTRVEAPFGDGTMEVWLSPGRAGRNDVHAVLLGADGAPNEEFDEAEFALALPAQDVGPIKAEPVRIGPGHFQLVGADLSIRGEWTLTVTVRPDRFTLTDGTVSFTIA